MAILIEEITSLYRSLPPRPSIEEVEAAMSVIASTNSEEEAKMDELERLERKADAPEELFFIFKEVKRNWISLRAQELRKEAVYLLDLENRLKMFDELIQRAANLLSPEDKGGNSEIGVMNFENPFEKKNEIQKDLSFNEKIGGDDGKVSLVSSAISQSGEETNKLTLIQVASLIESSAKQETKILNLKGKLRDQIEWLPVSLGKLQRITQLDLSENKIMAIPTSVGNLKSLIKLEIHSNQLINLPDSFGELTNLMDLDLHANRLASLPKSFAKLSNLTNLDLSTNQFKSLPELIGDLTNLEIHSNQLINLPDSFGELTNLMDLDLHANRLASLPKSFAKLSNLTNLDLSTNQFKSLPELIGDLTNLKNLNAETNDLEELPYTIGSCISLTDVRLDFNRLKGLPEAMGKLENLQTLTLHYNKIKVLPTTMANLVNLRELDVSFNELEYIPETLCFATNLVRLDVSRNFADLRALPRSIGNLEMLEEIDISSDQIRILPDSFRFLRKLRIFNADETPLDVPPKEIVKLGAQVVVQYMADLVASREIKEKTKRVSGFRFWFCSYFRPGKESQEMSSVSDMV